MRATAAILNELNDAALLDRRVLHIRVTTDGLAGTPTVVPFTPERARALGHLAALPDETVVADPASLEQLFELVLNPADYEAVLVERGERGRYFVQGDPSQIAVRVAGLSVVGT